MLRTALKYLLALTLILQGSVGAFASPRHPCDHAASAGSMHPSSPRHPCCPRQVCLANCDLCGVAFLAPTALIVVSAVAQTIVVDELRAAERSRIDSPPLRPPIA